LAHRPLHVGNQAALDEFIEEINRNGGIDVLANSLVDSLAPRR
jgi:hypothetical protein